MVAASLSKRDATSMDRFLLAAARKLLHGGATDFTAANIQCTKATSLCARPWAFAQLNGRFVFRGCASGRQWRGMCTCTDSFSALSLGKCRIASRSSRMGDQVSIATLGLVHYGMMCPSCKRFQSGHKQQRGRRTFVHCSWKVSAMRSLCKLTSTCFVSMSWRMVGALQEKDMAQRRMKEKRMQSSQLLCADTWVVRESSAGLSSRADLHLCCTGTLNMGSHLYLERSLCATVATCAKGRSPPSRSVRGIRPARMRPCSAQEGEASSPTNSTMSLLGVRCASWSLRVMPTGATMRSFSTRQHSSL
eukprot:371529-Amphidinium_carterae.1